MQKNSHRFADLKRSILLGVVIGFGIGIVFAAGFFFRDAVSLAVPAFSSASGTDYPLLREVQALLDRHYLRQQPSFAVRQYSAVRGMLTTLSDPYTFFIDPPVAASESDALAGTYGGIGVQLQRNSDGELVLYPFVNSPASRAGIEDGNILRVIDGAPIDTDASLDAIDQMLRGEVREGNGVEITVDKVNTSDTLTVYIPFAVINVPSVIWRTLQEDAQIGYVQVLRFTSRTPEELQVGLGELRAKEITMLILDLRDNAGGLLQESIAVADEFMDTGVVVYERNNREEKSYDATAGGMALDLPLAILVNERTASGAELVAGALQDSARGVLIGQSTFGKGTVQQIFPLSDRSSLHVTSAEWLTPNRQTLNESGLTPNISLIPDPSGRDVSLEEAIRYLHEQLELESAAA
jgi:carboxyl-terminal processing protease